LQLAPAVHATQAPDRHTSFVRHDVPSGAFTRVSLHDRPPSAQTAPPRWQGFPLGTQAAPFVQAAQRPALQ
jgi:hypothetical protein